MVEVGAAVAVVAVAANVVMAVAVVAVVVVVAVAVGVKVVVMVAVAVAVVVVVAVAVGVAVEVGVGAINTNTARGIKMELSKLLTIQNGRYVNQVCAAELATSAWCRVSIQKGAWTGWRQDLINGAKTACLRARIARKEAQKRQIGVHGL